MGLRKTAIVLTGLFCFYASAQPGKFSSCQEEMSAVCKSMSCDPKTLLAPDTYFSRFYPDFIGFSNFVTFCLESASKFPLSREFQATCAVATGDVRRLGTLLDKGTDTNYRCLPQQTGKLLALEPFALTLTLLSQAGKPKIEFMFGLTEYAKLAPTHTNGAVIEEFFKRKLFHEADVSGGRQDFSTLYLASFYGAHEYVKKLISLGENPNKISASVAMIGDSYDAPLPRVLSNLQRQYDGLGADYDMEKVVHLLLDNRANANITIPGIILKPIFYVAHSGYDDAFCLDFEKRPTQDFKCKMFNSSILIKLIRAGANPNELSEKGLSVAAYAASTGSLAALQTLIENGADACFTDQRGRDLTVYAQQGYFHEKEKKLEYLQKIKVQKGCSNSNRI